MSRCETLYSDYESSETEDTSSDSGREIIAHTYSNSIQTKGGKENKKSSQKPKQTTNLKKQSKSYEMLKWKRECFAPPHTK